MSETAVSLRLCDALAKLKGRIRAVSNLRIGYMGLSLGPQDPRGFQQTVLCIESIAGI